MVTSYRYFNSTPEHDTPTPEHPTPEKFLPTPEQKTSALRAAYFVLWLMKFYGTTLGQPPLETS